MLSPPSVQQWRVRLQHQQYSALAYPAVWLVWYSIPALRQRLQQAVQHDTRHHAAHPHSTQHQQLNTVIPAILQPEMPYVDEADYGDRSPHGAHSKLASSSTFGRGAIGDAAADNITSFYLHHQPLHCVNGHTTAACTEWTACYPLGAHAKQSLIAATLEQQMTVPDSWTICRGCSRGGSGVRNVIPSQRRLASLPLYLTIGIGRDDALPASDSAARERNDIRSPCTFPLNQIDVSPYTTADAVQQAPGTDYQLVAVVVWNLLTDEYYPVVRALLSDGLTYPDNQWWLYLPAASDSDTVFQPPKLIDTGALQLMTYGSTGSQLAADGVDTLAELLVYQRST